MTSPPAVNQIGFKAIQDTGHPAALSNFRKSAAVYVAAHGLAAYAQLVSNLV